MSTARRPAAAPLEVGGCSAFRGPLEAICSELPLSSAAVNLRPSAGDPTGYVTRLAAAEFDADLALFLAHGMTDHDAIWWGLVGMLQLEDALPDPAVGAALEVAGEWSLSDAEALRDEARIIAHELELGPPAAWLALAVSRVRPADDPDFPRHRLGVSCAIFTAIQLAATLGPFRGLDAYRRNLRLYLERGVDIARGGDGGLDRLDPPCFPCKRRNPPVPRPWLEGT